METWMEGIRKVQARRKEEMVGMANRNHSSASRVQDNKGKASVVNKVSYRIFAFYISAFNVLLNACIKLVVDSATTMSFLNDSFSVITSWM